MESAQCSKAIRKLPLILKQKIHSDQFQCFSWLHDHLKSLCNCNYFLKYVLGEKENLGQG